MTGRHRAYLSITINGQDLTSKFDPYLIAVSVVDREHEVDTCTIELDDTDARLALPQPGADIQIAIGWQDEGTTTTFQGKVTDVESAFTRPQGRRVYIEGWAIDTAGVGKEQKWKSWGEGEPGQGEAKKIKLSEVMQGAAQLAQMQITVDQKLGELERDFWVMAGESFHQFGRRIAAEVGGHFKVTAGNQASLTPIGGSEDMESITAAWGRNLIEWRIKPIAGRPQFKETAADYYDPKAAKSEKETKEVQSGGASFQTASAVHTVKEQVPTKEEAQQRAEAHAAESAKNRGSGTVILNGEPTAKAGAKCNIQGARPGVDGTYNIKEAEHTWHRGGGYTTRLDLDTPDGSAGTDQRYEGKGDWSDTARQGGGSGATGTSI